MKDGIDETSLDLLIEQLQSLRSELADEAKSLKQAAEPVELDQQAVGRVSRGDALQQQNMAKANLDHCQDRIRQIEDALDKIDHEDYGYCEACDEPIPMKRLAAFPEATLCVKCQSKLEQS